VVDSAVMIAKIKNWLKVTPKALLFHVIAALVFIVILVVSGLRLFSGESGLSGGWVLVIWILLAVVVTPAAGLYLAGRLSQVYRTASMQTEFLNSISHDLRTPLTSIRQMTELLLDERVTDESKKKEYLRTIHQDCRRLDNIVRDLLDTRRIEEEALKYHMRPLDLVAMIRETVELINSDLYSESPRIQIDTSEEDLVVVGDREALARALRNLADNALKYSPEDQPIRIIVRRIRGWVAIRVIDRGLGVPRLERRQIFQQFYRGSEAQKLEDRGSGLGLAIVKHIVKEHKGRVELESTTGKGSVFTIYLPLRE